MARFPKDAPKGRVIKALERLGFRLVRSTNTLRWCATTPTAPGRR